MTVTAKDDLLSWQAALADVPPDSRSHDGFSYPIFRANALAEGHMTDGADRAGFDAATQRRWDYFFRPDTTLIEAVDAARIAEIEVGLRDGWSRRLLWVAIAVGVVVIAFLISAITGVGVLAWGALLAGYPVARAFAITGPTALARERKAIEKFRAGVRDSFPRDIPSDTEMERALVKVLEHLTPRARRSLGSTDESLPAAIGWAGASQAVAVGGNVANADHLVARRGGLFAAYVLRVTAVRDDRLASASLFYDLILDAVLATEETDILLRDMTGLTVRADFTPPADEAAVAVISAAAGGSVRALTESLMLTVHAAGGPVTVEFAGAGAGDRLVDLLTRARRAVANDLDALEGQEKAGGRKGLPATLLHRRAMLEARFERLRADEASLGATIPRLDPADAVNAVRERVRQGRMGNVTAPRARVRMAEAVDNGQGTGPVAMQGAAEQS